MPDNLRISGKFFTAIYEDSVLNNYFETDNSILKQGLIYVMNGGRINGLDTIKIGSSSSTTIYTQNDLFSPLPNNSGQYFGTIEGLTEYQFGFINYFPVGVATGDWNEIGSSNGVLTLFNRAILNSTTPIVKGPLQTAFAGVIITIERVSGDD